MIITLDSHPTDAPGNIKIVAEDGRSILVQTDFDWPGTASTFGFALSSVKNPLVPECDHSGTDGTGDCPDCDLHSGEFIDAACKWLLEHNGATATDPGYF